MPGKLLRHQNSYWQEELREIAEKDYLEGRCEIKMNNISGSMTIPIARSKQAAGIVNGKKWQDCPYAIHRQSY